MPVKIDVQIDKTALYRELESIPNKRVLEQAFRPIIERKIKEAQEELVADFERHAVTRELKGGGYSENLSGTLGGVGNLFSFIGFERETDPVAPISKILRRKIKFNVKYSNRAFRIEVEGPEKEEIFEETPLPWATDSWARRIELGISGFAQYLRKSTENSRSGRAIQVRNKVRSGKFRNTPYLTGMLSKFYKKIGK